MSILDLFPVPSRRDNCWNVPRDGHQADCEIGREEARDEATADRLIEEVRRALPGVLVVDLTGWAPGEITEVMGR